MSSVSYNDSSPTGAMEAIDLDTSASGSGFFSGDPKKHDDLKAMLDSTKESLKLEGILNYFSHNKKTKIIVFLSHETDHFHDCKRKGR